MNLSLEEIRAIFKEDKAALIKKYDAEGAGIGKDGDIYVIVVYPARKKANLKSEKWKGIPVKIEVTGTFRKQ